MPSVMWPGQMFSDLPLFEEYIIAQLQVCENQVKIKHQEHGKIYFFSSLMFLCINPSVYGFFHAPSAGGNYKK